MPILTWATIEDNGGRTTPTGGSGGGPAYINPGWLDINWTFPTALESLILGFEVIAYTGADPTDASKLLFAPVQASPSVRRLVKSILPSATLPTVNAAVRAIYA